SLSSPLHLRSLISFPTRRSSDLYLLPWIGRLFSKDKSAYKYLSESASAFPYGERLNNILRKTGFIKVQHTPQTMGVATIYSASKDRKSTRLNSSHVSISYAVFCL